MSEKLSSADVTDRFNALSMVCSDLVLFVRDGKVVNCIAGDMAWLDAKLVVGRALEDLFPSEFLLRISPVLDVLAEQPGVVQHAQYVWRPERLPVLAELGLSETVWFEAKFVATESGEVLWCAKDISARKKLQSKLSNQAQRDPLTGAYTRRTLMTVSEQTVAQSLRYDGICSALIADIDGFSQINERFSWDAGDQLLQQIVAAVSQMKRTADFLARYGDDKVALILPETNHEQAVAVGERVRRLISDLLIPTATGDISCTVSVGVSCLITPLDTGADLLKRAQENMIIARSCGGDRVEGDVS